MDVLFLLRNLNDLCRMLLSEEYLLEDLNVFMLCLDGLLVEQERHSCFVHFIVKPLLWHTLSNLLDCLVYSRKNLFWEQIFSKAFRASWNNSPRAVVRNSFPAFVMSLKASSLSGSGTKERKACFRFGSS